MLRRGAVTREMDEEIAAHLAFATEEFVAQGVEPAEAARRARVEFGNVQRVRERAFEERAFAWLDDLARDLGQSWRQLRRTPAATLALVLCGALGIAGVTIVFSFLNAIWLRPLPYEDDDALNSFLAVEPQRWASKTMPRIVADSVEQRIAPLARSARFNERAARLLLSDSISEIRVAQVDSAVLSILRVAPEAGRAFTAAEYRSGAPVALVAPSIWDQLPSENRRAGSATVLLDGVAHRVVGRMSKSMRFNELARVWVPLRPTEDRVALLLRRDPGVSADSLSRAVQRGDPRPYTTIAQVGVTETPADTGRWRVRLMPLVDRGHDRPANYVTAALFLAVTALVAIATASNVAAQLVARARRRQHELATCAALGATAPRLVRRLLADSILIGGAAGLLGIVASQLGVRLLVGLIDSPGFPGWLTFELDWRILAFAVAATFGMIALIGVLPAREARRIDPLTVLREAGTIGITARGTRRATARLLALQFAVSVVFVSSATAIVQTYREMTGLALDEADARRLDIFAYTTNEDSATPGARAALIDSLVATLTAAGAQVATHGFVIGVRGTTAGDWRARSGEQHQLYAPDDRSRGLGSDEFARAPFSAVDTSFFAIDGRRIVAGRGFIRADSASGPVPIVITADLAAAVWGNSVAVGRALRIGREGPLATIVGVVTPRRAVSTGTRGLGVWERPEVFLPLSRVDAVNHALVVRTDGDPAVVRSLVRATGRRVDPSFYFGAIRSKAETNARSLMPLRVALTVIGGSALLVMVISLIGLHGIANQSALAQRQEIGIRLALGATESQVVRLVLFDTLHAILIGLIGGAGVSVIAIRALDGVLAFDHVGLAASTASAGLAFTAVIVLTCWIPARRVARIAPADVLRSL